MWNKRFIFLISQSRYFAFGDAGLGKCAKHKAKILIVVSVFRDLTAVTIMTIHSHVRLVLMGVGQLTNFFCCFGQ